MTMPPAKLDLRALAIERPAARPSAVASRRPWITRYLVPGGIILGFVTLLGAALFDQLRPRTQVKVVPVVVTRAEVQHEGTPLFQAAGWIEPRPTAVNVAALTEGVVEELSVVEGQQVTAGEPVARLINRDANIMLRQSKISRDLREAELRSAEATCKGAKLRRENPVHLDALLADSQSLLAKVETELARIPFLVDSAQAATTYAKKNYDGKLQAGDAISERLVQQARSELDTATSTLAELEQRTPQLRREQKALEEKVLALTQQRKLLIEESRQVEEAEAQCQVARARLDEAKLAVETAELALERTVIRAPISGRVLQLVAHPGARVMGLESTAGQNSSTVVTMYDPGKLQVRADVRLEDVPLVQPGQPVEIETASSMEPLRGTVLTATSAANIQKNTLEVKVAIDSPPASIRPEMLVTATFLAPASTTEQDESNDYERLLVPRQLVETTEEGSTVWIVTPDGLAHRQTITLGKAGTEQLVEVTAGIQPTDRLIASDRQALKPDERVTISGEDVALGID